MADSENVDQVRVIFEGPRQSGKTLLMRVILKALDQAGITYSLSHLEMTGMEHGFTVDTTDKKALQDAYSR
jgi:predicted AAA+ superfamily ATPase